MSESKDAFWSKRKLSLCANNAILPELVLLSDIISEQTATYLAGKDEPLVPSETHSSDTQPKADELDAGDTEVTEQSSDLLLAKLLQEEFDREYDIYLERQARHLNGRSKITISYEKWRLLPDQSLSDSSNEDSDGLDDDRRVWDSFDRAEKNNSGLNIGRGGFVKRGKSFTTKHDAKVCGTRNACRTMSLDISTGDGGGFDMELNNNTYNALKVHSISEAKRAARMHEKREKERSTDHVIDEKTMHILDKLVDRGLLDDIDGTIAAGKESHVLHGFGCNPDRNITIGEVAIKVYKTITNEFKNRDSYIYEDPRLKDRFSKQHSRKVVDVWAEKEMQNLQIMHKQGILCPEAVILCKHVLIMKFIGLNGKRAPCLKEAILTEAQWTQAYYEAVELVKNLYNKCRLVHGDLSEYNLLWHNLSVYVIDVGQSVVVDQPNAMQFLRRDCNNICRFFSKKGVAEAVSSDQLFMDVTGKSIRECECYSNRDIERSGMHRGLFLRKKYKGN